MSWRASTLKMGIMLTIRGKDLTKYDCCWKRFVSQHLFGAEVSADLLVFAGSCLRLNILSNDEEQWTSLHFYQPGFLLRLKRSQTPPTWSWLSLEPKPFHMPIFEGLPKIFDFWHELRILEPKMKIHTPKFVIEKASIHRSDSNVIQRRRLQGSWIANKFLNGVN